MYRYRCTRCGTTSPIVRTRVEMLHERDRHRRFAHGGHRPDGERLQRHRGGPTVRPASVAITAAVILALLLIAH